MDNIFNGYIFNIICECSRSTKTSAHVRKYKIIIYIRITLYRYIKKLFSIILMLE